MGNWRTVNIVGTTNDEDAIRVSNYLSGGFKSPNFGCLHNGGLCGLPNWGKTNIDVVGNLGERDYDENDIKEELEKIAKFAPSLNVSVHLGDNYEETNCVKTIVIENGIAEIIEPQVDEIRAIPEAQMQSALFAQLGIF